ncbi:MAG: universal stress protein [Gemmatimonadetes bacterium]|uniref:Universal stress protein n=1 Tax=Candidatus Kutchimonas denitrificans TaxID=3056748 RepID=A0AAE4Z9I7_9BACT|nr:universal stress protein [Gemmatimonadota bacterium]NIR76265.1 universal stress protein [Candidatus Kutchimonas denitrificans]NIS02288.1 universal stress protein [Gemmatimonadota bacterium]NIT68107.1 universal stress protein [Gemmatimonadota bacterium]NIU54331.1 universal stress protein [Gemmatimonadota bacterium]
MYREVFVPCDNSQECDYAIHRAIELARKCEAGVVGNHVYAAKLHDVRFRQLESGLPARFQPKEEIQRQRKIHDKLIEKGLQLISDSFLDRMEEQVKAAGVKMKRQLLEGIHFEEIAREVNCNGYDLCAMGAHGLGRQPHSQLGGVVSRVMRRLEKDLLITRTDRPLRDGVYLVCVDGSSYSYRAARVALELAREFEARVEFCSAFDLDFHHIAFNNIKDVLSYQASRVFKFEEQEELHNNIIDKGLLKLCKANLMRAEKMAEGYPEVETGSQVLIGKPFESILEYIEELEPTLLVLARHGSHRIEGTDMGSQVENLVRLAPCDVLLTGTVDVRPEDVPWIEEDGVAGLEWDPLAAVRIQRVPPFAQGIARNAVEEWVEERGFDVVTNELLDQAIGSLLPTHMQLVMGIGQAEEIARAEVKAEEALADRPVPMCPMGSDREAARARARGGVTWSKEAWERLELVPLIARPLARSTVERFAKSRDAEHVTVQVMDENKQAMIEADTFDVETMMVMFSELRAREIRAGAEGAQGTFSEAGGSKCPIREVQEMLDRRAAEGNGGGE